MVEEKAVRISKAARELGVSVARIVDTLADKGFSVENNPNAKISEEQYSLLQVEFESSAALKREASEVSPTWKHGENVVIEAALHGIKKADEEFDEPIARSVLDYVIQTPGEEQKTEKPKQEPEPAIAQSPEVLPEAKKVVSNKPEGLKVIGKIDLDTLKKPSRKGKPATKPVPAPAEKPEPEPVSKAEVNPEVVQPPVEEPKAEKIEPVEASAEPIQTPEIPAEPAAEVANPEASEPGTVDPAVDSTIKAKADQLKGLTVKGKIDLQQFKKPEKQSNSASSADKKKRQRIKGNFVQVGGSSANFQNRDQAPKTSTDEPLVARTPTAQTQQPGQRNQNQGQGNRGQGGGNRGQGGGNRSGGNTGGGGRDSQQNFSQKDVKDAVKNTLAKFGGKGRGKKRYRKEGVEEGGDESETNLIKVTEFCSVSDLASLMDVSANEVISICFQAGMMVSINQRLDAEVISFIADEFGFEVEFTSAEEETLVTDEVDTEESLVERAPIVTIMGHVDHGKTSLLDYIRSTNVIAGEAGGITQHVAAYEVTLVDEKKITFVDTPGHEAFTAMRARGAKVTDIVIIVIAADDSVMPQTKEAIAHAQAAGVPIIFAYNKIDKEGANADRIREQLSAMSILVEEWGGKYQSQEISAKKGINIDKLLEKVLLEAELLELKANPDKRAKGTVMETHLDKGKGVVASLLVQEGTIKVGDFVLAGSHYGRVRALLNERDQRITLAGPSTPVSVLGFQGAPTAGELFLVFEDEQTAKEIANKRTQLQREQGIRASKHITLEEIGRRLAVGSFKELKLIVKGDVDGSVEALSDSLLKLSKDEVQVSVIHKGVGQITESDVLLASASDAIIIGFQVRPAQSAKKLAEDEEIEIKTYSVIYHAIEEIKAAIEGMLSPEYVEEITANIEVREVYKITKVGTVGGCYVLDGKAERSNKLRIIRDGVVVHEGEIETLKRFKDDVKEVAKGYECGIQVKNYNDIREGDIFETYKQVEVKRKVS